MGCGPRAHKETTNMADFLNFALLLVLSSLLLFMMYLIYSIVSVLLGAEQATIWKSA
ncbi:hypothetical protein BDW75DRAFT_208482 [Aspergillus navahoensis]